MDYNKLYQSRIVTAEEAVRQIKSGMRIFLTGNCSVPKTVLAALVDYAPNLQDVEICQALSFGPADYVKPEMQDHLRVNTMFVSANVRKAVHDGRADFTPVLLSEFTLAVQEPLSAAGCGADPGLPAGRAWLLQPGRGGRSDQDRRPNRQASSSPR